ncbi:uncharacterized protein [Bos taurus]|uniref:uncharacterized protein isoform X3 n=1 Tax=Bos taurus TaxID=9913 RepID=UPI000D53A8D2|nr:uncharacterized protein LOC101904339 isoform X3 [Bos taurus]
MRDSARTVWISPPERRGAHSTPDYGLRKKRQTAGRKAELTRSACYDWVTELPVTKRDRLTWSWRAGLLRSRAWSLVKPAGRGGQEGGTPRLPVGCLRRGARGDGRGDAQGGARSTETAPSFASPPPSRCTAACLLGPGRGQSPAVCWVVWPAGRESCPGTPVLQDRLWLQPSVPAACLFPGGPGVVSLLSLVGSHCLSCHTFLTKRISQLLGDAAQTSSTPSAITHFFGQSLPRLVCLWLQDGPPSSWSHR